MTELEPVETTNLDRYGNPPLAWAHARDGLAAGTPAPQTMCFLGTCGPGGRPHAAGVGALWFDGALHFTSGPGTRKSQDLASNPACTLSIRLPGIDLVCEGEAARVTDLATLQDAAARYRAGGWPAEVEDGALVAPYSAPSAGPPPWHLFRVTARSIVGIATAEPPGATRWRFAR